ncbi:MAG TPA: HTH domain-containing protein [Rhizobiaceae bacterium]|nr:HTH domain-containing protein [Rhizobiaceae bacterium]
MLLLLQNRGRMTSAALARELEVSRRTILRDVDAMTEAGLPIVVLQGNQGGIELGFNYRTRLTGLADEEAEALAVMLTFSQPVLRVLGLENAGKRAASKLVESLPDKARETVRRTQTQFRAEMPAQEPADPRVAALAGALRSGRMVRLRARSTRPVVVHPVALLLTGQGWSVVDARDTTNPVPLADWGDINISVRGFTGNSGN